MFEIGSSCLVARGGRMPRVGFWRLLWAQLMGRCGFCGGAGFRIELVVRPYKLAPYETIQHSVQCPCCLRTDGDVHE